ncbi:TonB-dependent receptor domain-containing protein [Arcticibacterium luteifluviistationis]|uniref:TonB-dependent receptor n=1 Tax=Arcticibacterium luteifluviistationis TaxID=1784714 RepID=A0A2Z4G6H3_9BACT|nr:outer membrane beta-barrel family protein [Arcticibacterium luteifluviistationis]AWV96700.1 TonB-dependent receptor [Arcticibacterium luteifluviistationis]
MKKLLLGFLLLFTCFSVTQVKGQAGNATISGVIVDSVTNGQVEFAAVALWSAGKAIDGTLTTDNGKFKFEGVKGGTYKILVSFVGYQPLSLENIAVKNNASLNLGNIKLVGDNIQLDAVTVVGQSSLIEDKIDRLVYNAEKDISNTGGTAEEVLRKVPMLSVDLDGEVELRGSSNVRILINNKPSAIFASSVGEALRQIPSDQIKSVEVITSPSAKYDGEGTAGIVNIILKKNTLAGVTGSLNLGVGVVGSSANGSVNLRDGKWGISLSGSGRASYNYKTIGENTRESVIDGAATYLTQLDDSRSVRAGGRYSGTFDYDFDKKTNFSVTYSLRNRVSGSDGDQLSTLLDNNRDLIYENLRDIDQTDKSNSSDLDFTFTKRYANPIQELTILAQVSQNNTDNYYTALQNGISADSSENQGKDRELSFQLDYVQPLGEKVKWEVGGKGVLRSALSDGQFYSYNDGTGSFALNDSRSNFLDYDQNVLAGYSSFTFELPNKWGVQAGVRYEKTTIDAEFKELSNVDIPDYDNFLPSITLSKRFKKAGSIRTSYTQRIQRPSIRYLNPFVDYSNANSISFGSPTLSPELVDMLEVAMSTYFGSNSINFSVFSRIEDNSITSISNVTRQDGLDVTETTYGNIGVNKRYGSNISMNLNPTNKWRLGGGVNVDYTYMDNRTISNEGWSGGVNLNTSYSFPKDWAASFFAFYRSPRVQLQGTRNGFYFHGITVKKNINKKRGSIGLGLENPFAKTIDFKSALENRTDALNYFITSNNRSIYRRSIRIDFQYRFGKMESDGKGLFRRKSSNRGNDAVDGGDAGEGDFR